MTIETPENKFAYAILRSVNLPPHERYMQAIKGVIDKFNAEDGVMRLLSSIENRLIELAGGPGIGRLAGWLERLDKDLYHVTTRQESIDIEQRRALDNWGQHLHDMIEPKDNENGCPEPEEATPLEDISDELLDQMKEQIPVKGYVAEVERRQKLKTAEGERAYTGVNTDWLAEQLRISQTLERFWRDAAATMGQANIDQRERIMQMGDLIDGLTNRR